MRNRDICIPVPTYRSVNKCVHYTSVLLPRRTRHVKYTLEDALVRRRAAGRVSSMYYQKSGIVHIAYADDGRCQIRHCGCSVLAMATLSTKNKHCLLMTAVFSVHSADRYGAYIYFKKFHMSH